MKSPAVQLLVILCALALAGLCVDLRTGLSAQSIEWAHRFDTAGQGLVNAVALDRSNGVFITGYFTGTNLRFGTITLTNTGNTALVIGKLDASGEPLWAFTAPGIWALGQALAADTSGNVIVAGAFGGTLTVGTNTLVSHTGNYADLFLTRLSPSGEVQWAKTAKGDLSELPYGITVDGAGNAYVCGEFGSRTMDFGSVVLTNSTQGGLTDGFVVKYDAQGSVVWARGIGGIENDRAYGIGVDSAGCVYVTGVFWSPAVTLGATILTNSNGGDFFLTKLDSNGNPVWAKSAVSTKLPGIPADDIGFALAVDKNDTVHVTGFFHQNLKLGAVMLSAACCPGPSPFVAAYSSDGNLLWAKAPEEPDISGTSLAIACDAEGSSYITGLFGGTPTFGTWRISSFTGSDYDPFVVKYDARGQVQWATAFGGRDDDRGYAVAVSELGHVYVGGRLASTNAAMAGTGTNSPTVLNVVGNPESQLLVAKLAPPIAVSGSLAGEAYRLSVSGAAGRALTVQTSTNFASWTTAANFTGTNLTDILLVPRQTEIPVRFFRVTAP